MFPFDVGFGDIGGANRPHAGPRTQGPSGLLARALKAAINRRPSRPSLPSIPETQDAHLIAVSLIRDRHARPAMRLVVAFEVVLSGGLREVP